MPVVTAVSRSLPPSGTASGDLSGTYPGPTVAKVNGIAVTGTPSTGFVPTATSASAATWQAAGGSQPLSLLGPYAISYNSPGIDSDGFVLTTLPSGTVIIQGFLVITTIWNVSGYLSLNVGGSQYLPPDDSWDTVLSVDAQHKTPGPATGVTFFGYPSTGGPGVLNTGAILTTAGALIASGSSGAAQGAAVAYALTYTPS